MREIVYSRCSEMRILATAGILIRCERRETTTPIHWFYHLCLSRSHPIQLGNVFSGDQNRLPSEIWISQSRNFFDPENIWTEMSVELGQMVPPNLDSRPLDLDPDSFVCSDMLGTQPEELILPLSFFWPTCHFCLTKWFSSPRAESARAVTGRRCPHSGKWEDQKLKFRAQKKAFTF